MRKYTYHDMGDKSKAGVTKELQGGLTIAAIYFYNSLGVPLEVFNDWISRLSFMEQLHWYMNFRNEHAQLYK